MKTHKKLVSIFCAVALLVSALPAATAAEPLSEYAGKTVPVQIVEETADGWVTRFVEVSIPEGSTKKEELALTNSAVFGQGAVSAFSTAAENSYFLSEMTNLVIDAQEQKVGGGKRPSGVEHFDKYAISVDIESVSSPDVSLLFQIRDAYSTNITSRWVAMDINHWPWRLVIVCNDLPTSDKGISVYAKTSPNWPMTLNSCTVQGIVG